MSTETSQSTPAPAPARAGKVLVRADDLRTLVAGVFRARGTREAEAAAVADALVWANLRGIDSHGVSRVPRYLELFDKGESVLMRCRAWRGRAPRSRSWTRTPPRAPWR